MDRPLPLHPCHESSPPSFRRLDLGRLKRSAFSKSNLLLSISLSTKCASPPSSLEFQLFDEALCDPIQLPRGPHTPTSGSNLPAYGSHALSSFHRSLPQSHSLLFEFFPVFCVTFYNFLLVCCLMFNPI